MNFCEHVQDVLVNFVVKLSIVSEKSLPIIKLTQDALKEHVVIKFLINSIREGFKKKKRSNLGFWLNLI